jgi:selenophosphate synthase
MSYKSDIQATRSDAAAGATAIIAQPIRLRGIIIASDGTGAGLLELSTTSNTGATLFIGDVPSGDVVNFSFPEDGILFPKGIFCKTKTKVTAYTLLTDKYSGPNLTAG